MTSYIVSSGYISSGITLSSGSTETVDLGGVASVTTAYGGGDVINYGATVGTVLSGGYEGVGSGSGASSGGVASDTTINSGGTLHIDGGATAAGTIISSGGAEIIYGSGFDQDDTVYSGASQTAFGVVESATVFGSEVISSGGVAELLTVSSGGSER